MYCLQPLQLFTTTGTMVTVPLDTDNNIVYQDILENEDVKLDNMFVASLVADIIRVSVNINTL